MKERAGELDLWKFIFAIVIVIHHSSYLPNLTEETYFRGGSIGVEYFFIVSGFLMARSSEKITIYSDLAKETCRFLKRKVKSFFPYMLFALIISATVKWFYYDGTIFDIVKIVFNAIVEVFLLRALGLNKQFYNTPTWYLSAMIFSMTVIYPLILKYRKMFTTIVCPVLGMLILGYLYQKYGHFRAPDVFDGFVLKGTLRAFAEICLGVFCYEIYKMINKVRLTKVSQILMTLIEYGTFLAIIFYSNLAQCWDLDCVWVVLIMIAVVIAGGNFSIASDFWNRYRLINRLGKFSLMIYLNHIYWVWIFAICNLQMSYQKMLIVYLICSCFSALCCWLITDSFQTMLVKHKETIKRIFVIS